MIYGLAEDSVNSIGDTHFITAFQPVNHSGLDFMQRKNGGSACRGCNIKGHPVSFHSMEKGKIVVRP
jgi:hypothetical protein